MKDHRDKIRKELKEIAPILSELAKPDLSKEGVTEGYFEQFPDEMWKHIQSQQQEKTNTGSLFTFRAKPILWAIAASLIVVMASIFLFKTQANASYDALNSEDLLTYMMELDEELDDEILYSLIEDPDLIDFAFSEEEELIDYYLEQNIEELDDSLLEEIF